MTFSRYEGNIKDYPPCDIIIMTYTDHFPTQDDHISFLGIKLLFGESRKLCLVLTTQQLVQLHLTQFLWCETQKTTCHTINHQDLYQTEYEYCNLGQYQHENSCVNFNTHH
jgi:hypothetical protein